MAEEQNGAQPGAGTPGAADGGQGSVEFSEEQQARIDVMIAERVSRANKSAEAKAAQDLADARAKWEADQEEAAKIAQMSEQQRKEHDAEKASEELVAARKRADELQAELTRTQMVSEASKMLADKGLVADEDTLEFVVRDTADETTAAVAAFTKLIDEKVEAKRQESLRGKTPNNPGTTGASGKSLGQIAAERANGTVSSHVADDFFGTK
ncbi:DUF4355 domain-containing protein [Weissella cibaria]|uniref:DUF4355 domain-containing protein n=1 Tax=Weissella cibaria TaxID=137591 RepID=UPI00118EE436|nr:DUF4355 domain-containing protein [Weissella cibaria]TVV24742.1 DUF4355 domain-containing protein [Weissella cibaria]